jgi:hypothetical protein
MKIPTNLSKALGPLLLAIGVCLILFVAYVAYGEYLTARNIRLSGDIGSSLTEMLSLFSIVAVKAIFLAFIVWGGGILLSNGVKLLRGERGGKEEEEGRKEKGG